MLERNMLLEKTFPQIKLFCQTRGYEFQVVDMRWGVRDESTDDHMGTELCLKELIQCRDISTGPIFVVQLFINYYQHFFVLILFCFFKLFYLFSIKMFGSFIRKGYICLYLLFINWYFGFRMFWFIMFGLF